MSTRAKFTLETVTLTAYGTQVSFRAAYGDGNEAWSAATPVAKLEMSVTNPAAAKQFTTPGKSYYIDIEEVQA